MFSRGYRGKFIGVQNTKKRKASSTNWLQRQLNDPYIAQSKIDGYKSRAAYKLIEIQDKYKIFQPGANVIDLGAAPGGWSQVASNFIKSHSRKAHNKLIAIDLLSMDQIPGVISLEGDFLAKESKEAIHNILDGGLIDVVMSDMASNTTGHSTTDHLRILELCENAFEFALYALKPKGHFIAKIFRGGAEINLLTSIKKQFDCVKHFKPKSSRKESSELYLIALNKK